MSETEAEEIQRKEREAGNTPGPREHRTQASTVDARDQLDKLELQTRAVKLRHYQEQRKMIEEANEMTKHRRTRSSG